MNKFFPKLTQKEVFIQTDAEGNGFNCPMLPISALGALQEFATIMSSSTDISELKKTHESMLELASSVIPEEYSANLQRLDLDKLSQLLAYLMYGDPKDDDAPKKKAEKPLIDN